MGMGKKGIFGKGWEKPGKIKEPKLIGLQTKLIPKGFERTKNVRVNGRI